MTPLAIEVDPNHVYVRRGGEVTDALEFMFKEEDVGRIQSGYVCINCLEDLDTAFPDECPICHFPMAQKQAERFAKEFTGNVRRVGPSTTLDEEREIMVYLREEEERKRQLRHGIDIVRPQIILPRGVR